MSQLKTGTTDCYETAVQIDQKFEGWLLSTCKLYAACVQKIQVIKNSKLLPILLRQPRVVGSIIRLLVELTSGSREGVYAFQAASVHVLHILGFQPIYWPKSRKAQPALPKPRSGSVILRLNTAQPSGTTLSPKQCLAVHLIMSAHKSLPFRADADRHFRFL